MKFSTMQHYNELSTREGKSIKKQFEDYMNSGFGQNGNQITNYSEASFTAGEFFVYDVVVEKMVKSLGEIKYKPKCVTEKIAYYVLFSYKDATSGYVKMGYTCDLSNHIYPILIRLRKKGATTGEENRIQYINKSVRPSKDGIYEISPEVFMNVNLRQTTNENTVLEEEDISQDITGVAIPVAKMLNVGNASNEIWQPQWLNLQFTLELATKAI